MIRKLISLTITIMIMTACNNDTNDAGKAISDSAIEGTFGFDRQFLSREDSSLIVLKTGNASVLVSAKYQGKVFTSTAAGNQGKSFGWINYEAFSAPVNPHINAYGGENRFWLGPEGGKYSLYFKKGDSMVFDNWKTPAPIDTESWNVLASDSQSVTLQKEMKLTNYTGHTLAIRAERKVSIQDKEEIERTLGIELSDSVDYVGYATENLLRNTGTEKWNETTGMPCIWILDMFTPSPNTTIVIPFKNPGMNKKVATTDYFGEIGSDRLNITENIIFFKADGKKRGKMGILPEFVLPVAGSYDADNNILTITHFDVDNKSRYLNQVWNTTNKVYSGDAMNAYNDGPLEDGTQMGPFYEIESVSPAAVLEPDESIQHNHKVYHFTGSKDQIDSISKKVLGADLSTITQAFKK